ncbi:MAG: peroxidase-related enzyme [Candidatus Promineofilum sp.]|nr:peroxidase-related enzyme [Promineifilum sp.]
MAFISTVPEDEATAGVKQMYDKVFQARGYVPNYTKVFSHRPQVMEAWIQLQASIKSNMDARRFELVTLATARALKSSYCMLAHGSILRQKFYAPEQLTAIAKDYQTADLTPAEVAMMAFAEQIARDATAITQEDVDALREHGFSDPEIFDITATATARCFFSKTLDALGAQADEAYLELEDGLRETLTVGRPISGQTKG